MFSVFQPVRRILYAPFLLICLLTGSCAEERIRFPEPQPSGTKADARLRKPFPGTYFNAEDSVWLLISEDNIRMSNHLVWESGKSEEGGFEGQFSVGKDSVKNIKIEVQSRGKGDSLDVDTHFEELVIDLNKGGVAKYYKGYYFLNTPIEGENAYRLRILQEEKHGVSMLSIQSDSVLHLLEKEGYLSKSEPENGEEEIWTLKPSRRQLRDLMKKGLFAGRIYFERQEPGGK